MAAGTVVLLVVLLGPVVGTIPEAVIGGLLFGTARCGRTNYTGGIQMFTSLRTMLGEPEGRLLVASAATALVVGTVVYVVLEGWTVLDSLYFCVVCLATVGFGDLHPTTDLAKLFTILYILTGLGILAAFVSELTKVRQSLHAEHRLVATSHAVGRAGAGVDDVAAEHSVEDRSDRGSDDG